MSAASHVIAPRFARPMFAMNGLVAMVGVLVSFTLNITGFYTGDIDPTALTILGNVEGGIDSPLERFFDWITYFTILSNIVVALVMVTLTLKPQLFARRDRVGFVWRSLRLDSIIMIVVTGVVYNLLLASGPKEGWDAVSNAFQHNITPVVTVLVWLVAGPRGLVNVKVIVGSLVIPVVWAAFALVRGVFVGAYPYPFLDVSANGYSSVLAFIVQILAVAVVLAAILLVVDLVTRKVFHRSSQM